MSRLGWNFQGPEWYCSGRWLPMDIPLHTLMLFVGSSTLGLVSWSWFCYDSATGLVALAEAGCTFPLPFAGFTWNVYGVLSLQTRSGMVLQSGCVWFRNGLRCSLFSILFLFWCSVKDFFFSLPSLFLFLLGVVAHCNPIVAFGKAAGGSDPVLWIHAVARCLNILPWKWLKRCSHVDRP